MKIYGTRFVLLTGAITTAMIGVTAMNGCSSAKSADAADGGSEEVAPIPRADSATPPDPGGGDKDSGKPYDSGNGGDTGGGDSGGDAGKCLDDTGAVYACPAAPQACADNCASFELYFKKQVAADIFKCHFADSPTCVNDPLTCRTAALAKTCADPTAATFCTALLGAGGSCETNALSGDINQATCVALAKGLTQEGRDAFDACGTGMSCSDCVKHPDWW